MWQELEELQETNESFRELQEIEGDGDQQGLADWQNEDEGTSEVTLVSLDDALEAFEQKVDGVALDAATLAIEGSNLDKLVEELEVLEEKMEGETASGTVDIDSNQFWQINNSLKLSNSLQLYSLLLQAAIFGLVAFGYFMKGNKR